MKHIITRLIFYLQVILLISLTINIIMNSEKNPIYLIFAILILQIILNFNYKFR